jgi:putative ABC transport system permease protein
MIRNYFNIAFRSLLKNRGYNIINIAGLGLGIAAAILIFSYLSFEYSYDNFHNGSEKIFRVLRKSTLKNGEVEYTTGSPLAFQKTLISEHPELGQYVPIHGMVEPVVTVMNNGSGVNGDKYNEDNQGLVTDPSFFEVFNFPWLIGNPKSLAEPNVVALSETMAKKYFGDVQKAVGQNIKVNGTELIQVVGVIKDAPLNTDFNTSMVFSYESKRKNPEKWGFGKFDDWGSTSSNDHLFLKLADNQSESKTNAVLGKFAKEKYKNDGANDVKEHFLGSLDQVYFDQRLSNFKDKVVSSKKLKGIGLIGVLIVLMACFNFINIATAIIGKRIKEVGVRKTLGSYRSQLAGQFLSETFIVCLLAVILGLLISVLGKPWLSALFDLPEGYGIFSNKLLLPFLGLILLLVTLFSGLYPAIIMSNFSPLEAFRSTKKANWRQGLSLRKALIVFQFAIAIFLVFSTLINVSQLKMLDSKDMGYVKDGVLIFSVDPELRSRNTALRSRIEAIPGVSSMSFNSDPPSSGNNWQSNFAFDHRAEDEKFNISAKIADAQYFKTFGLKMLAGKSYENTDSIPKYVVNETMLKKLGNIKPEEAIGKQIKMGGQGWNTIVGVVKDFQTASAKEENSPIIIFSVQKYFWNNSVKITSGNLQATVAQIKAAHDAIFPEYPFNGKFYEENIANYYKAETQQGLIYKTASGIAIFIACLGLLGMAAFYAEQRKKEIGIRKVMGAGIGNILQLMSKDFLILVLIATLLSLPLAYYFSKQWLQGFVHRIDITWEYFVISGLFAALITIFSVSYQAIKAALMNPVKSLKSE